MGGPHAQHTLAPLAASASRSAGRPAGRARGREGQRGCCAGRTAWTGPGRPAGCLAPGTVGSPARRGCVPARPRAAGRSSAWLRWSSMWCGAAAGPAVPTAAGRPPGPPRQPGGPSPGNARVPQVVPREQLSRANGRLYAAELTSNEFVGPPLAGFLVAAGAAVAFATPVALWAVAITALLLVRGLFRIERDRRTTMRADIGEGLRFLWRHRLRADAGRHGWRHQLHHQRDVRHPCALRSRAHVPWAAEDRESRSRRGTLLALPSQRGAAASGRGL